jgi:hypothetical protein
MLLLQGSLDVKLKATLPLVGMQTHLPQREEPTRPARTLLLRRRRLPLLLQEGPLLPPSTVRSLALPVEQHSDSSVVVHGVVLVVVPVASSALVPVVVRFLSLEVFPVVQDLPAE